MQVPMLSNIMYVKSKNPPRMATLSDKHFGNPGRSLYQAHYNIVHKKSCLELFSGLLSSFYVQNYGHGLECLSRRPHAAAAGGRALAAAGFLTLYM